jgi:glutamate 5-kinase
MNVEQDHAQREARATLVNARHWAVKIGSNTLLRDGWQIDRPIFAQLVRELDWLIRDEREVTVVSSGAVALGRQMLGGLADRPLDVSLTRALAAMGQARLIQLYEHELSFYGRHAAQLLFTRADLDDRRRYLHARAALQAVQRFGAVPIINENDTVATDELRFGDNDQLAAMTCGMVQADVLVILSDIDGIYEVEETGESRRFTHRIPLLQADDPRLDAIAGPSASGVGTGGMVTKILAARIASRAGIPTVIAPGKRPGVLEALARGEDVGTLLLPSGQGVVGRKVWISGGARAVGSLVCDEGAQRAVQRRGASLLPSGIKLVHGEFGEGAVVELVRERDGEVFARGISAYAAVDLRKIVGHRSEEIATILSSKIANAIIHRNDLIVL